MTDLLTELCPGASTSGLRFTGQDVNPDTQGRPDLVATDSLGTRLVVEAKFDAALTPAQTSDAYVSKLKPGVPGALVFLVPEDRLHNLWKTVAVTPGGAQTPVAMGDIVGIPDLLKMSLPKPGHVLATVSWQSLINRIEAATTKLGDNIGAAELAQLRGLVQWRTKVGWVPLASDDLPQRVGRQLEAVNDVLKAVASEASEQKLRPGTSDGGFGRYLTTPSGKSIWVGTLLGWWDRYGPGPAWAQVKLKTAQETSQTAEALTAAGISHRPRTDQCDVLIPLNLPLGAEKANVESAVSAQIEAIINAVDGLGVEVVEDLVDDHVETAGADLNGDLG